MRSVLFTAVALALLSSAPMAVAKDGFCPPGLAKKTPACIPPGQAKKQGYHDHDDDRRARDDDDDDDDDRRWSDDREDEDRRRLRRLLADIDGLDRAERRELVELWDEADAETRRRLLSRLTDAEARELRRLLDVAERRDWRFDDDRRDLLYWGDRIYQTGDRLPDGSYVVIDGDRLRLYPPLGGDRRYVQLDNDVVAVVDATGNFVRALKALSALSN